MWVLFCACGAEIRTKSMGIIKFIFEYGKFQWSLFFAVPTTTTSTIYDVKLYISNIIYFMAFCHLLPSNSISINVQYQSISLD